MKRRLVRHIVCPIHKTPLELVASVVVVALVLAVAGSLAVVDSPLLASDLPPPQAARARARVTERRRGEEVMAGRYAGAIGLPRILRDRRGDAGPITAFGVLCAAWRAASAG